MAVSLRAGTESRMARTPLHRIFALNEDDADSVFPAGACFFFILFSLMLLRPARESLGLESGLDTVRWLFMLTLLVTLAINPAYSWPVARVAARRFGVILPRGSSIGSSATSPASTTPIAPRARRR